MSVAFATMSAAGTLEIPARMRKDLNLGEGSVLRVEQRHGELLLVPEAPGLMRNRSIREAIGMFPKSTRHFTDEEIKESIGMALSEKYLRS